MKNLKHPSFIIGVISIIVLMVGIGFRANGYQGGDYIIGSSVVLGFIHWVWTIVDVIKRDDMKAFQKRFWLIVVVACPVLGGMFFYTMHQERGKIIT